MTKEMKSIPLSMHEDIIERHFARDATTNLKVSDVEIEAIRDAALAGREAAAKMLDVRANIMANQMATPIANEKNARETIYKIWEVVAKKVDVAVERANKKRSAIMEKIAAPPQPKDLPGTMVAAEIRATLASMSAVKRKEALSHAIASSEDAVLAAAINAPQILTGLTQAEKEMLLVLWRKTRFPAEVDLADRLENAMADVLRGAEALMKFQFGLTDQSRIEAAEKSEHVAAAALCAVN
ncbi:MAG: hypothetical protein J0I29_12375 [Rhizobiales bacterium]|nr:hypothetical protein [Hyphomicrobiales bacterium]